MASGEKFKRFLKKAWKPAGFIFAPLVFAVCLVFTALALVDVTVDDIRGFGSVLLLSSNGGDHGMTDFLDPELYVHVETRDEIPITQIAFPRYGSVYGELIIDSVGINCPLVYGDGEPQLALGAGQSNFSKIVGYPGTSLICAHVNRQFAQLHAVQVGDTVQVNTTYGRYVFQVTDTFIARDDEIEACALEKEEPFLALYTCYYERTAFGSVKKRFFVHAEYVSGPVLI